MLNEPTSILPSSNMSDSRNDNSRTNDNCLDSIPDTSRNSTRDYLSCENDDSININIYRYTFTNDFMEDLYKFSKVHQYDKRADFKEAWQEWTETNENIVSNEVKRLIELGYEGDVIDKMYKSARYYFRKKSPEKKTPVQRRIYVSVSKELIAAMDDHISREIYRDDYKPSDAFDDFCKNNIDLLKENITILCKNGVTDSGEIKKKIKKTYKNRYFIFVNKEN
jgi:hypothetical protein